MYKRYWKLWKHIGPPGPARAEVLSPVSGLPSFFPSVPQRAYVRVQKLQIRIKEFKEKSAAEEVNLGESESQSTVDSTVSPDLCFFATFFRSAPLCTTAPVNVFSSGPQPPQFRLSSVKV